MHYTGQVYRPPLERNTPLLEVTYGCSHNSCAFCTMYDMTSFGVSPLEHVESDIIEISLTYPRPIERIYLLNGDPFVLSTEKLLKISELIHKHIPEVKIITTYASFYNLKNKTKEELKLLKEAGYDQLYFGVETGDAEVLTWLNKGAGIKDYYEGIEKMAYAGIDYYAIVMQGVKGRGKSIENARATAKFLNAYPPIGIFVMSTAIQPGSKLYDMAESGEFVETTNRENIEEQLELLRNLEMPDDTLYSSGHVVNLIKVSRRMRNKASMIEKLEYALANLDPRLLDKTQQIKMI